MTPQSYGLYLFPINHLMDTDASIRGAQHTVIASLLAGHPWQICQTNST